MYKTLYRLCFTKEKIEFIKVGLYSASLVLCISKLFPHSLPFDRYPALSFMQNPQRTRLYNLLSEDVQIYPSIVKKPLLPVYNAVGPVAVEPVKCPKQPHYFQDFDDKGVFKSDPELLDAIKSFNDLDKDGLKDSYYVSCLYRISGISGFEPDILQKQVREIEHILVAYSNALK